MRIELVQRRAGDRTEDESQRRDRSDDARGGTLLAVSSVVTPLPHEQVENKLVRFRTIGDMTCTGAVDSPAATVEDIILEVAAARITERGATRADDAFSETSMEDRKREGYF